MRISESNTPERRFHHATRGAADAAWQGLEREDASRRAWPSSWLRRASALGADANEPAGPPALADRGSTVGALPQADLAARSTESSVPTPDCVIRSPVLAGASGLGRIVVYVPARGSVRLVDGSTREMPLAELTAAVVLSAVPWRSVRAHRGQRHLPGWYWSATTGGHVVYESRLELARLLLADFDPEVLGIAAQPFLVTDVDRRHVPDFLLQRADGSVLIVNVKPAERLEDERIADALAWAGRVFGERGWEHEVWSGANAQLLANVRFLAGYRRAALFESAIEAAAVLSVGSVLTIAETEAALSAAGVSDPRPLVLHLLWSGRVRADPLQPLTSDSELEVLR